jgi:hypothetical protein
MLVSIRGKLGVALRCEVSRMLAVRTVHIASVVWQQADHAVHASRTRGARHAERRGELDAEGNPLKVPKPKGGSRMKQGG